MSDPDEPSRFWKASGLVDRSRVCLVIYGETLDPGDVSALLQCEPTQAWQRGVVRNGRSQPRGAWFLEVEGQAPIGPEELLDRLLARLPEDVAVWLQLGARYELQWRITMRIAEVSRGFVLSADMQQRLAPLKVPLLLDFYPNDDEDEAGDDVQ